ncbi:MAG: TolC family protein [Proteobacteria bacterium]|nr:TolC family protein [Pseudomonadota bacterium]MBU1419459.1 TolC family protein [Pseudomonadota bacterium]MBU1454027.1 TolC family protein [Pseudomonadota bacterium]
MKALPFLRRFLPLAMAFLVSCSLAPQSDYTARTLQDIKEVSEWQLPDGARSITFLNQLISSPQLDELLAESLSANPGLQQALLTLRIVQAEHQQVTAERLPQADAGFSAGREEGGNSSYTGALTISWELDLWRKLADADSAAAMDVAEQQSLLRSARDVLAAEVMKSWLLLIADKHAIDIEKRRLATLQQNEQFILQRYRNGIGALEDLDTARSSTASSRATLEGYTELLAQQQRSLQTMLGRIARSTVEVPADYPQVNIPLTDLPEQTLQRRPDLQAAYFAIDAAGLRTSVAYKDLLPSINLKAVLEDIAESPRAALFADPIWSLLGQLTAPLYQGGRLKAAAEVAELETARLYQIYRETLLTAVNEVEDALGREESLARQQAHLESALASADNTLVNYQDSYRTGLATILDLLSVQQQTYDLETQLDTLYYERLTNRIDLGLALGLGVYQ